ncbi:hypothetical protein [Staphylococcus phage ZCSS1]|nr:hypothetical protein [Staphylococcus phage ZCSS1]
MTWYDKFKDNVDTSKLDVDRLTEDLVKYVESTRPKVRKLDISNVEDINLDKHKPLLQFVDYDNVVENICNVKDINDGLEKVSQILKDSNYESHYFRTHEIEGTWYIDYGSHTTQFRVTKGDN